MSRKPQQVEPVPMRDYAEEAPAKQRAGHKVVTAPEPIAVKVWLRQRQTGEFEADGWALEWTSHQVRVRYFDPHGREGTVWVWAAAVTRR